ncbi:MAG TPA: glycosyltransferase family 4 protein [Chthoniobacterales bacterium]|jgi:glycosyltransferase involved in cell wall biosynthesis|nr:glycosyltransferase family 4 protein [Chthoniobacterales bacterium]
MPQVAYLFERFPSFGQTFCYREVAELERQGTSVHVFSIRWPVGEPQEAWDKSLVDRVHYLPEEKPLVAEVDQILKTKAVADRVRATVKEWGRQSDFLRLYQAIFIGMRLREKGLKHIHAHFAGMAARTAYWIGEFFGIRYSFTAHANDIFAPRTFVVSLAKLIEHAAAVVTVSDYAVSLLQERFPESGGKIHRVYNGVDLSRFTPTDFAGEPPQIISIGRLIEKKGFSDLIGACALLQARGRRFACRIIGEGPLEESLRGQIAAKGLEKCVLLTGPQTQAEIAAQLAHATVFALPCTREADGGMDNLPTVIMEAMAAGLPVVSTPLGGIPEMVEDGVNGELVPERDPAATATAIERLIDDPQRARSLGDRGREIAREKFSIEESALQLREIFERML